MKRIGILGDIGSGKSYIAKNFGYPVFDADKEVSEIYQKDNKIFLKLKKVLPDYFVEFPIKKNEIIKAILKDKNNLKKIIKIIHVEIRKKLKSFIKKNKNKKFVILDIPLLLENKINTSKDILIYVESKKSEILKKLKKRPNYNKKLINKFKKLQLSLVYKKKKSNFIIKNNFTYKSVKKEIDNVLIRIS